MASDAFRRELLLEAQRWRANGLISEDQFQTLAQNYQFEALETAARDRFIMILLGLGSVLVGIGAITFVAANWQALSQTFKAGLLFIAMLVCNLSGFAMVNRITPSDRGQRLGQALLLLGALLLGANLALMGQIVHTSSTRYELCAVWAIGVLAMAYGTRLPFLGMLALLLLGIGYWSAVWNTLWLEDSVFGIWSLQLMPLLVAGLFLPLTYRCRSALLFALTAIAVTSALIILILDIGRSLPDPIDAFVLVMPLGLLWAYDDTLWAWLGRKIGWRWSRNTDVGFVAETAQPFQPIARGLMVFSLSMMYWLLSFQDVWLGSASRSLIRNTLLWRNSGLVLLTLAIFSLWTIGAWLYLGWRQTRPWQLDSLSGTMLVFLLLTATLFFWTFVAGPIPIIATTLMNILLAVLSLGMMREGLGTGSRAPFWWGLVMLTLQILSRVLEYETGLLVKSLVFLACGVAVIIVGLWFERYVRTLRVDSV